MTVIPNFILKRLYVPGSFRRVPEGVAFDIFNNLGPGMISKVNAFTLNGISYPPEQLLFMVEGQAIQAEKITEESPASFYLNQTISCVVKDHALANGTYDIVIDLVSKEAGKVTLSVQDSLS